ncbi:MAG: hypothetical protein HYW23_01820 [Candidatus Aenigmarchaeota archaeon]|nr:hypothetical protein [Candidatus Aenigmarchaeota archaeon]
MAQIELQEQDLEKVDELVKEGLFSNRNQVIRVSLERLLQFSKEEIRNMEEARAEVNAYLTDYVGDILSSGTPLHAVINSKDYYKVPVTGFYQGKFYTYGHIFVDCQSLEINESISDSPKKIHQTAKELTGNNESPLL